MRYDENPRDEYRRNPEDEEGQVAAPAPVSHPSSPKEITRLVLKEKLWQLEKDVGFLQRRAVKLGLAPLALRVGGTRVVKTRVTFPDGSERTVPMEMVEITLSGESPRIAGWDFAGTIDHSGPLNVVRAVPGHTLSVKYREGSAVCEHCRTSRDRKETFVLEKTGTDRTTQVGRSCLADYLGHKSAEQLASLASHYATLFGDLAGGEYDGEGGGGGRRFVDREQFLAFAVDSVKEFGFHKTAEEMKSTSYDVLERIDPPLSRRYVPPSAEGERVAKEIVAWGATLAPREDNDYMWNLKAVLAKDAFGPKDYGIAANSVSAYERELGWRREREEKARSRPVSKHFGKVGERVRLTLILDRVLDFNSEFGPVHRHIFRTPEGNVAEWKTGSERLEPGQTYDMVCAVKGHDEYKDVEQTLITRCADYVPPPTKEEKASKASEAKTRARLRQKDELAGLLLSKVGLPPDSIRDKEPAFLAKEEAALGGPFFQMVDVQTEEPLYEVIETVVDPRSGLYGRHTVLSETARSGPLPVAEAEEIVKSLRAEEGVIVEGERTRLQREYDVWFADLLARNRALNVARSERERQMAAETPDPRLLYKRVSEELPRRMPDREEDFRGRGYWAGSGDDSKKEVDAAKERLYKEQRAAADRVLFRSRLIPAENVPEKARIRGTARVLGWTARGRDAIWEAVLTLIDLGDPQMAPGVAGYVPDDIEQTASRFVEEPRDYDSPLDQARKIVRLQTWPSVPTADRLLAEGVVEATGQTRHYPRSAPELRLTERGRGVLEHLRALLLPPKKTRVKRS